MPSTGHVKRKVRQLRTRARRLSGRKFNNFILDPEEPVHPVAVGGQGKAAGIFWADFPVDFYSPKFEIPADVDRFYKRNWANKFKELTIVDTMVQLVLSCANTSSLARKVLNSESRNGLIKAAQETSAPKFGLSGSNKKWATINNSIPQSKLPWAPEVLRRIVTDKERIELECAIHKIGNVGARSGAPGFVMMVVGTSLMISWALFTFALIVVNALRSNHAMVLRSSRLWNVAMTILMIISAICVFGGVGLVSLRKGKSLDAMQESCIKTTRLWKEEDLESDIIRKIDVLCSEEIWSGSRFINDVCAETVSLWNPATNPQSQSRWSSICQPRKNRSYFLRYSEYPKAYHAVFQRTVVESDDIKSSELSESDIEYSSDDYTFRSGVVCNPYIHSSIARNALVTQQYHHYFSQQSDITNDEINGTVELERVV